MVVVVALVVLPGQRTAALLAGMSAGVWFDFFLTKPYERFSIQRSSDVQTTVLLAVVAVLIGEISVRRRQARSDTRTARDEVLSLYVVAEMLSAGSRAEQVVTLGGEQLRDPLLLADCHFDPRDQDAAGPLLERSGELHYGRLDWSLATDGLPNQDVILPVESRKRRFGCYVLRGPALGAPISQDRRLAAVALSDRAGAAVSAESAGQTMGQSSTASSNRWANRVGSRRETDRSHRTARMTW